MAAFLLTSLGKEITARWRPAVSGGAAARVMVRIDAEDEVLAFNLPDESPLYLAEWPDGRLILVYQDSDNNIARKWSRNHGQTWGES